MRILSQDEMARLLEHASESYKPLLLTALFTGLRRGELLESKEERMREAFEQEFGALT